MPSRNPTLDDLAKGFLGATKPQDVQVVRGQKANAEKQRQLYEQEVMHEACEYGDVLVVYVGATRDLTVKQRAFGVALGLFNLRRDYPEGGPAFDALVDLGGADLKYPIRQPPPAEEAPPNWKFTPEELEGAAKFAELFIKYVTTKKNSFGITNTQAAYGLGRTFHTLRYTYPIEEGGTADFDHCAQLAGVYFGNG